MFSRMMGLAGVTPSSHWTERVTFHTRSTCKLHRQSNRWTPSHQRTNRLFYFLSPLQICKQRFFFWTIFLLQLWRGWPGFKTGRNYMGRHIYNHLWFPQLSSRDSDLVPERSHCISRYTFIAPATRQKTHLVFFWEYEMLQNMKQALPILWLPHSKALPWMIVGS